MFSFNKKRSFAFLALIAFVGWGELNNTGFCVKDFRYVPDKLFFARYLESSAPLLKPSLAEVREWTNNQNVYSFLKFESGWEYLEKYTDCCSYGPLAGVLPDSDHAPTFFQRFFGTVWGLVVVHYRLEYVDESDQTKLYEYLGQGWVDSCGYRVKRY